MVDVDVVAADGREEVLVVGWGSKETWVVDVESQEAVDEPQELESRVVGWKAQALVSHGTDVDP